MSNIATGLDTDNHDSSMKPSMYDLQALLASALDEISLYNPNSPLLGKSIPRFDSNDYSAFRAQSQTLLHQQEHARMDHDTEALLQVIVATEKELMDEKIENERLRVKVQMFEDRSERYNEEARQEFDGKIIEIQKDFLSVDAGFQKKTAEVDLMDLKLRELDDLVRKKNDELHEME